MDEEVEELYEQVLKDRKKARESLILSIISLILAVAGLVLRLVALIFG